MALKEKKLLQLEVGYSTAFVFGARFQFTDVMLRNAYDRSTRIDIARSLHVIVSEDEQ